MNFDEANNIYKIWKQWYWPCHFMLHSIFMSKIPSSFLPYPTKVLEEALNIVAEDYFNAGDKNASKTIQDSISSLAAYSEDEEALDQAAKILSDPKFRKVTLSYISNFKTDWNDWLARQ